MNCGFFGFGSDGDEVWGRGLVMFGIYGWTYGKKKSENIGVHDNNCLWIDSVSCNVGIEAMDFLFRANREAGVNAALVEK